jgi:hypothetical protein
MLGYEELKRKFTEAKDVKTNAMSESDYAKFKKITDYTYDTFDVTFGNRILNQIANFVPVLRRLRREQGRGSRFLVRSQDLEQGPREIRGLYQRWFGRFKSLTASDLRKGRL